MFKNLPANTGDTGSIPHPGRSHVTKINKIGNRKTMKKFWLFEKTDKVDKRLTSLTKKKTDKTQITNVKNEIKCITTDSADIKGTCVY